MGYNMGLFFAPFVSHARPQDQEQDFYDDDEPAGAEGSADGQGVINEGAPQCKSCLRCSDAWPHVYTH